jgi:hypothetical protein
MTTVKGADVQPGQVIKYRGRWYEIQSIWHQEPAYRVASGWQAHTGRGRGIGSMILGNAEAYPVRTN